jgi:hypothetical protein
MSKNETISPINHGVMSSLATTGVETSKSGLSGIAKGFLFGPLVTAAAGAVLLGGITLVLGTIAAPVALLAGASLTSYALGGLALAGTASYLGGIAGAIVGCLPTTVVGMTGLGAVLGIGKGIGKSVDRISREQGEFNRINAPVQQLKYQAQIMQAEASGQAAKGGFSSRMNAAMPSIQADSAQYDGRVAAQQELARA